MMIERISNFRMVRTVSEGENGTLMHAVSDKTGERVAILVQSGDAATTEREQLWKRAVRVARLLAHPAVVRLIQAGRLDDGRLYLIKEQLVGETLAARLTSRPRLPLNEVLRLGRQIATVLVTAHARGIYHCALRPESLQLVPDPEAIGGERVKITDWGFARVPPGPSAPAGNERATPGATATVGSRGRTTPDPMGAVGSLGRTTPGPFAAGAKLERTTPAPIAAAGSPGRTTPDSTGAVGSLGRTTPGPFAAAAKLERNTPAPSGAAGSPGRTTPDSTGVGSLGRTTPGPFAAAARLERTTPAPGGAAGSLGRTTPAPSATLGSSGRVTPDPGGKPALSGAAADAEKTQSFAYDGAGAADSDSAWATFDDYPGPAPAVPLDAPTYLAPEQCRAAVAADSHSSPVDPAATSDRVDVYALGVLLYQLAAGQLPFSGRVPSEIIAMHIAALPPKLEQRVATIPAGLATLVAAMLIKDPSARPTMREVEERLQQLGSQQQLAQTMTPASRISKQDLVRLLPSTSATVEMRVPDEPPAPRLRSRLRWALTGALGLAALVALWQALGMNLQPLPPAREEEADFSRPTPVIPVAKPPSAVVAKPAVTPLPTAALAVPVTGAESGAAASPAAPVPSLPTPGAPVSTAIAQEPAAATPQLVPPLPKHAAPRRGIPPLRDLSAVAAKAPARPLPIVKKATAGSPPRTPESAAEAQDKLLAAQSALDRRDYAIAIAGATALFKAQPEAAALLLGQAGCATNNLTVVNRAYPSLRQRPAALTNLSAECKKYGIELGVSGQFVRTKTR